VAYRSLYTARQPSPPRYASGRSVSFLKLDSNGNFALFAQVCAGLHRHLDSYSPFHKQSSIVASRIARHVRASASTPVVSRNSQTFNRQSRGNRSNAPAAAAVTVVSRVGSLALASSPRALSNVVFRPRCLRHSCPFARPRLARLVLRSRPSARSPSGNRPGDPTGLSYVSPLTRAPLGRYLTRVPRPSTPTRPRVRARFPRSRAHSRPSDVSPSSSPSIRVHVRHIAPDPRALHPESPTDARDIPARLPSPPRLSIDDVVAVDASTRRAIRTGTPATVPCAPVGVYTSTTLFAHTRIHT